IFFLTTVFSRDIGPNLSSMGIKLSGLTVDEATETLFVYWNEEMTIDIMLDDAVFETVAPADIGISLDATATAQAAKDAGLSGFPFGQEIEPVLNVDYGDVQAYMLAIGNAVYIPSYEAGYEWRDGQLASVMGTSSRELDVLISIQRVTDNALQIVTDSMVSLATTSTPPAVVEADPYFDDALSFITSDFIIEGYDPFTNDSQRWATTRQEMADWLVVTDAGLTIREDGLEDFVNTVNQNIDLTDWSRYLDPVETYDAISTAFLTDNDTANVRIRYADSTYELQQGDWGLRLGRRLGLPLFNIQTANPGMDWDDVYAGQNVSLPSRDLVVPLDPVINKRIVVDLDRRYLVAYENDEVVHHWPISIGRTDAQTHPGVFQILSKFDIAFGSSFSLCNADNECGQWEMDHFMGIYEVGVGLTNGFHGTVRLPNGGTLTRGSTQSATTFGCVMSDEAQAQILYEWAETGVVVELVDAVFPPQSDLGRDAMTFIDALS
ncbi:MAG: L,D-transpeptidase family protein, partial [Chloroflexota bacterium]